MATQGTNTLTGENMLLAYNLLAQAIDEPLIETSKREATRRLLRILVARRMAPGVRPSALFNVSEDGVPSLVSGRLPLAPDPPPEADTIKWSDLKMGDVIEISAAIDKAFYKMTRVFWLKLAAPPTQLRQRGRYSVVGVRWSKRGRVWKRALTVQQVETFRPILIQDPSALMP